MMMQFQHCSFDNKPVKTIYLYRMNTITDKYH